MKYKYKHSLVVLDKKTNQIIVNALADSNMCHKDTLKSITKNIIEADSTTLQDVRTKKYRTTFSTWFHGDKIIVNLYSTTSWKKIMKTRNIYLQTLTASIVRALELSGSVFSFPYLANVRSHTETSATLQRLCGAAWKTTIPESDMHRKRHIRKAITCKIQGSAKLTSSHHRGN